MSKKKSHPINFGEYLDREISNQNKTEFARRIGISRSQLYNLINNRRRLRPDVAENLGEATGKGAKFWLQLELDHRVYLNGLR
jgi:plasmid maintenance system antidote protein VapI